MIKNFRDKETESIFISGKSGKYPASIIKTAIRKLDYLNAAVNLNDLRIAPGNRLEALKGKLKGKYSIRINDQFRIVFKFERTDAIDVEIIDYHK